MKKMLISVFIVMIMALSMVSIGEAGACPCSNGNLALSAVSHNGSAGAAVRDADRAGDLAALSHYSCVTGPARTDYVGIHFVPCPTNAKVDSVPNPMGSPGW